MTVIGLLLEIQADPLEVGEGVGVRGRGGEGERGEVEG